MGTKFRGLVTTDMLWTLAFMHFQIICNITLNKYRWILKLWFAIPTNKLNFTVLFNKKLQNCYKIKDCQANWAIKKTFRTNSNAKCQKSMCFVTSFSHNFVLHYIGKANHLYGWKSQKTKVNVKMAIRPRNLLNDVYTTKALSVLVFLSTAIQTLTFVQYVAMLVPRLPRYKVVRFLHFPTLCFSSPPASLSISESREKIDSHKDLLSL